MDMHAVGGQAPPSNTLPHSAHCSKPCLIGCLYPAALCAAVLSFCHDGTLLCGLEDALLESLAVATPCRAACTQLCSYLSIQLLQRSLLLHARRLFVVFSRAWPCESRVCVCV